MQLEQSHNLALGKAALYGIARERGYDAENDEELAKVAVVHFNEVARLQELLEAEFAGFEPEKATSDEDLHRQVHEAIEKGFRKYIQKVN